MANCGGIRPPWCWRPLRSGLQGGSRPTVRAASGGAVSDLCRPVTIGRRSGPPTCGPARIGGVLPQQGQAARRHLRCGGYRPDCPRSGPGADPVPALLPVVSPRLLMQKEASRRPLRNHGIKGDGRHVFERHLFRWRALAMTMAAVPPPKLPPEEINPRNVWSRLVRVLALVEEAPRRGRRRRPRGGEIRPKLFARDLGALCTAGGAGGRAGPVPAAHRHPGAISGRSARRLHGRARHGKRRPAAAPAVPAARRQGQSPLALSLGDGAAGLSGGAERRGLHPRRGHGAGPASAGRGPPGAGDLCDRPGREPDQGLDRRSGRRSGAAGFCGRKGGHPAHRLWRRGTRSALGYRPLPAQPDVRPRAGAADRAGRGGGPSGVPVRAGPARPAGAGAGGASGRRVGCGGADPRACCRPGGTQIRLRHALRHGRAAQGPWRTLSVPRRGGAEHGADPRASGADRAAGCAVHRPAHGRAGTGVPGVEPRGLFPAACRAAAGGADDRPRGGQPALCAALPQSVGPQGRQAVRSAQGQRLYPGL
jgi:hypothetical protein